MAVAEYTKLIGYTHFAEETMMSQIETNMVSFFQWALLGIGAWFNVGQDSTGVFGGSFNRLRYVNDPAYSSGQIWEGPRKDWVWETGVGYISGQPVPITGVFVNGVEYPSGHATYGFHVNYPLGRVVFNSGIPNSSVVQLNYSYRWCQIYKYDDAPWFKELQYRSFRLDNPHFFQQGSGEWDIFGNHRVQLPAVVVEVAPRREYEPFQHGNVSQWLTQEIRFHILAENAWGRNRLIDYISLNKDRTIWMYDLNKVNNSGVAPLDYRGQLQPSGRMYSSLVDDFRYKKLGFSDITVSEVEQVNPYLYRATVRIGAEVVFGSA